MADTVPVQVGQAGGCEFLSYSPFNCISLKFRRVFMYSLVVQIQVLRYFYSCLFTIFSSNYLCVCVCACMIEIRERERENFSCILNTQEYTC